MPGGAQPGRPGASSAVKKPSVQNPKEKVGRWVNDPMNPLIRRYVDENGNPLPLPSGSSGKVSAGTFGVGKGNAVTKMAGVNADRSAAGIKRDFKEGVKAVLPVDSAKAVMSGKGGALDYGILAASVLPVPGARQVGRAAEVATNVARTAGRAARGAGKTRAATIADTAAAAARRTAEETKTIAAGTKKARSEAGAKELEKQEAAMASRKSVNAGKPSSVVPRSGTETGNVPKGATDSDLKSFVAKRAATRGGKQTPAQAKRAQADLADSLKRGARMSREGRAPGEDIPAETGRGVNEPVPSRATPPKAKLREDASKAMKGKKAQENLAQRNRDYSEGRRDAEGNLKGASAKSARRQQEKVDKAAGVKKPSAKVEAVAKSEKPATAKTAKAAAEPTPPKPGTDLVKVPSTRGQKASGPVVKSGAPRPMGGGRTKDLAVRPVNDIVQGKVLASKNVASKGSKLKSRVIKAGVTGAVLGAGGLAINKLNLGDKKKETSGPSTPPPRANMSATKPTTTKAAIEAKEANQSKANKFGPTGESRFQKGRPAVRQSVIDGFKKRGMTKSLALVKSRKNDPEYLEAVRRYYGESRLKKAMGS